MPTSAHAAQPGNGKAHKKQSNAAALIELAAATISVDAILELIDKLGVKDLLVSKLRSRLEDADVDGLIDDAFEYLRRNPEALVIVLGAITVATGAIVFLESRHPHRGELASVEKMTSERRRTARM
ncbi:MAG TPA: hypothetical protein VL284_07775 [Thermoanaerobaculia bacterium]|nr:hypothetical protein [Thermoanaerobaculia bacterium]